MNNIATLLNNYSNHSEKLWDPLAKPDANHYYWGPNGAVRLLPWFNAPGALHRTVADIMTLNDLVLNEINDLEVAPNNNNNQMIDSNPFYIPKIRNKRDGNNQLVLNPNAYISESFYHQLIGFRSNVMKWWSNRGGNKDYGFMRSRLGKMKLSYVLGFVLNQTFVASTLSFNIKKSIMFPCDNCGQIGHRRNGCQIKICNFCGQKGHWENQCMAKKERQQLCFYCQLADHKSKECTNIKRQKYWTQCSKCLKYGHFPENCGNVNESSRDYKYSKITFKKIKLKKQISNFMIKAKKFVKQNFNAKKSYQNNNNNYSGYNYSSYGYQNAYDGYGNSYRGRGGNPRGNPRGRGFRAGRGNYSNNRNYY